MVRAALGALAHPRWWPVALAGFLVRGGVLVALVPIVILPTPAGLANAFGTMIVGFVFGGPSPSFLMLAGVVVLVALVWLLGSAAIGAWLDLGLAREAVDDEDLELTGVIRDVGFVEGALVRLIAHVPTAFALAWGAVRVVEATYEELISPGQAGLPVALRVVLRVPDAVTVILVAWLIGETVGGIALRRTALGSSVGRALGWSFARLLRPSWLATIVLTTTAVVVVAVPGVLAAGMTWEHMRVLLMDGARGFELLLALSVFVATWLGVFGLLAIVIAWRSTAWTVEVAAGTPDHPLVPDGTADGAGSRSRLLAR